MCRKHRVIAAVVSALAISACGAAGEQRPAATPPAAADPGGDYPAGPYAFWAGATMPNLAFTDRNGQTVTLAELRTRPGVRVLLWSSGAEWCGVCKGDVPNLERLHDQSSGYGLLILESLYESFDSRPADPNTLARWDQMFAVNYLLGVEPSPPYQQRVSNPLVWTIQARTMRILSRESGSQVDVAAAARAALAASP
jgi:hypothetical protein